VQRRPSGQWSEDDYDVLATGAVIGRIFKANGAGRNAVDVDVGFGYHEDRTLTHGYEPRLEAAVAAFAKG
jgi:hypothetical protein